MSPHPLPHARTTDLNVQSVGPETLVYDRRTDKAYVLNPTAAAVWHACNGKRSVRDLAEHLSQDSPTSEKAVWYALGQLHDLLEDPVPLPPEMARLSRRKFLKMTGAVAAGVTIPLVVTLVAPAPAHAQSGSFMPCRCGTDPCAYLVNQCIQCEGQCALDGKTFCCGEECCFD